MREVWELGKVFMGIVDPAGCWNIGCGCGELETIERGGRDTKIGSVVTSLLFYRLFASCIVDAHTPST